MKWLSKFNTVLASVLFCGIFSFAQVKYSNEFLSIGVGARALGMSNSNIASVNDATSGYWNPAGLSGIKTNLEIAGMHSEYFAGIAKYEYFGAATRIDSSSVMGASFIRFGVDNIPNTTELIDAQGNVDYDRITTFSAADYAFLFSYARTFPKGDKPRLDSIGKSTGSSVAAVDKLDGLSIGANAKIIRRKVGNFGGAWGFGIDAAIQYKYKGWMLGAMVRDITTTFNAWSYTLSDEIKNVFVLTGNEIPSNSIEITLPKLIVGGARKMEFMQSKFSLLAEMNFDMSFDGKRNVLIKSNLVSIDPHMGIEAGYKGLIFLRTGIGNIQKSTDVVGKKITTFQPNIGLGIKIKAITLDYALTDIGDKSVALYSNVFSLKLAINKTLK